MQNHLYVYVYVYVYVRMLCVLRVYAYYVCYGYTVCKCIASS